MYIIAYDVGTSSIKTILFDVSNLTIRHKVITKLNLYVPKPGYAEQSPDELWKAIVDSTSKVVDESGVDHKDVVGIVMDTQMAGVVPVSRDGTPLTNILTWLDMRAAGYPKELFRGFPKIAGYNVFKLIKFLRISGGVPGKAGKDPLSKYSWLKNQHPEIYRKTWKFLDVKGYITYRMTGKAIMSTDEANLTWLTDSRSPTDIRWSTSLIKSIGLDIDKLPEIRQPTDVAGNLTKQAADELGLSENVKVVVGCGDMTATAIGSGAIEDYETHIYMGTSDWLIAHVPQRKIDIYHYMGCLPSAIPGRYMLIAEQETGSAAIDWILKTIFGEKSEELFRKVDELALKIDPESNRVIFLPWLFGERSPIDDPYVRGGMINISLENSLEHLVQSVIEGIAFNVKWAFIYYQKLLGKEVDHMNIVGGGALYDSLCTFLANSLNTRIIRVSSAREASAIGASIIGLVGLGIADFNIAKKIVKPEKVFDPDPRLVKVFDKKFRYFIKSYKQIKRVYREINK
ncbi:MAG: FGGY-family carbohydrate kinase [Thermoprotei archaeon]